MNSPAAGSASLRPERGWHCAHLFYKFDRGALGRMGAAQIAQGRLEFSAVLAAGADGGPARLQTSIVSGQKADFGLLMLDPDPLVIDSVHQRLRASHLGAAILPAYSFISLTEVSEYVPTVEQYGQRLVAEGVGERSEAYRAKLKAYENRFEAMTRERLTPDLPTWLATCFYPMNKKREADANWFLLPLEQRSRLMTEHGRTGMAFGGKVSQLITVGVGLDDWEWGVTLWARKPEFLKDIVYTMRFDEASARYAEFGPFYTSYVAAAEDILNHCRIG